MSYTFPDTIVLRDAGMRGSSRIFALESHYRYRSSRGTVLVPRGFKTDGASIPRVFWSIFDPYSTYFPAALIHDYLYSVQSKPMFEVDRLIADLIFKEAMFNLGIGWMTRETIFRAVRLFGGRSYKKQKP